MKHKRTTLTVLAAVAVLTTAGGAWYTTLDTPAGEGPPLTAHGMCLPATETDEDRAGYAHTIALVTVDRTVEYREESADPGGALVSAVTVVERLKGAAPERLTIGQSVLRDADGYAKTKPAYLPLEPGHQYVVGIVPDPDYSDGWIWFATAADTDPAAATARWTHAVDRQIAPHPDPACDDITTDTSTPPPAS
ncbi:hypothetical protein R6L23_01005 [Streptomyces sp. SR27]|uniref:hypothetical protein n=1 Tax=Streptomyces sp. SR27 TaxID=3076630 RepID=UPI00295AF475|nr:hypothetical protein [Streptomyces sp. SR27]MDV9186827.1 hypothetical protein [Streptomyces sp. SR27]